MRYDNIPYVIYSCPEIAGVGETEESLPERALIMKTYIIFAIQQVVAEKRVRHRL